MSNNPELSEANSKAAATNPAQKRLKTALALHKHRKLQFKNQLESNKEPPATSVKSRNSGGGSNETNQLETLKS